MKANLAIEDNLLIKRKNIYIAKKIDNVLVILDIEKSLIYECNEMAEVIWIKTARYRNVKELVKYIANYYGEIETTVETDVKTFIADHSFLFDFK